MKFKIGEKIRIVPYREFIPIENVEPPKLNLETLDFECMRSFNCDIELSYINIHGLVRARYIKPPLDAAFIPSKKVWMKCE